VEKNRLTAAILHGTADNGFCLSIVTIVFDNHMLAPDISQPAVADHMLLSFVSQKTPLTF